MEKLRLSLFFCLFGLSITATLNDGAYDYGLLHALRGARGAPTSLDEVEALIPKTKTARVVFRARNQNRKKNAELASREDAVADDNEFENSFMGDFVDDSLEGQAEDFVEDDSQRLGSCSKIKGEYTAAVQGRESASSSVSSWQTKVNACPRPGILTDQINKEQTTRSEIAADLATLLEIRQFIASKAVLGGKQMQELEAVSSRMSFVAVEKLQKQHHSQLDTLVASLIKELEDKKTVSDKTIAELISQRTSCETARSELAKAQGALKEADEELERATKIHKMVESSKLCTGSSSGSSSTDVCDTLKSVDASRKKEIASLEDSQKSAQAQVDACPSSSAINAQITDKRSEKESVEGDLKTLNEISTYVRSKAVLSEDQKALVSSILGNSMDAFVDVEKLSSNHHGRLQDLIAEFVKELNAKISVITTAVSALVARRDQCDAHRKSLESISGQLSAAKASYAKSISDWSAVSKACGEGSGSSDSGNLVQWQTADGVTASDGKQVKEGGKNDWGSGALSKESIKQSSSTHGVSFRPSQTDKNFFVGLKHTEKHGDYTGMDFGFYCRYDAIMAVWENNVRIGRYAKYEKGDKLEIVIVDGKVQYRHNGNVFYTSKATPRYPLWIDTDLNEPGVAFYDARFIGSGSEAPKGLAPGTKVAWQTADGVTASDGKQVKEGGKNDWGSGALSKESIKNDAGVNGVSFRPSQTDKNFFVGLKHTEKHGDYTGMDFGFYCRYDAIMAVWENNVRIGRYAKYEKGDKLEIVIVDGKVQYRHNGNVFYTSKATPRYPLWIDTDLNEPGVAFYDAQFERR